MNPFDFIKDASFEKKDLIKNAVNPELAEKEYNSWLTNEAFSLYPDTILHANRMNFYHDTASYAQYLYFLNALRRKKRFAKWVKNKKTPEEIEMICELYQVSVEKAKEYRAILSDKDMKELKKYMTEGGHG